MCNIYKNIKLKYICKYIFIYYNLYVLYIFIFYALISSWGVLFEISNIWENFSLKSVQEVE